MAYLLISHFMVYKKIFSKNMSTLKVFYLTVQLHCITWRMQQIKEGELKILKDVAFIKTV